MNKSYDPYCDKCGLIGERWEKGVTYEGIDGHHNPPEFMLEEWEGEIIPLCRKHHRELHDEIRRIMFEHSTLFKPNKSDYWTWIKVIPNKRGGCIEEVIKYTKGWIDGNSKEITK